MIVIFKKEHEKAWAAAILLVAAILYITQSCFTWVGSMNDDAAYILLAKSLLQGSYQKLQIPGLPWGTTYPPGLPLVLAPFVWIIEPQWGILKALPIFFTLLTGVVFWTLLGSWLRGPARLFGLGAFLFSPFVVAQSPLVTSDSFYVLLLVTAFWQLDRLLRRHHPKDAVALGLILGAGVLVRSAGIIVLPVFAVTLWMAGRRREAVIGIGMAAAMSTLFPLFCQWVSAMPSGYTANWMGSLRGLQDGGRLVDHLNRVLNLFFVSGFLGVSLPYSAGGLAVSTLLTGGVWITLWHASRHLSDLRREQKYLLFALAGTAFVFFVMHALWTTIESRYTLPALPPLAALVATSGQALIAKDNKDRRIWLAIGVLLVANLFTRSVATIEKAKESAQRPDRRPLYETWKWIRANLPPDARIQTALDAQTYLYTSRQSVTVLNCFSAEEYRDRLLKEGVTHVMTRPSLLQAPGRDIGHMWRLNQYWAHSDSSAYKRVFENQDEATAIFEVISRGSRIY